MSDQTNIPAVLVTGASRGIGRGIAIQAAAIGWSVGINYLSNSDAALETKARCEEGATTSGQKFHLIKGNVATGEDRLRMLEAMLTEFNGIDALVNNAGMAPRARRDILETTPESFHEVMETNLTGPYFLTQTIAQYWLSLDKPCRSTAGFTVVNISSISAEFASINRGEYCVSKAGLSMATKLWATRLAPHGINVLEIRPGIIESDMTVGMKEKYNAMIAEGVIPEARWGTPEDIGKAVASILRGDIRYASGSVIYIDGGLHLPRL